jgi:hypothetical protein
MIPLVKLMMKVTLLLGLRLRVGCSGDTFAVILSGSISLQFTKVHEETDELENEMYALPENSSVYPFL